MRGLAAIALAAQVVAVHVEDSKWVKVAGAENDVQPSRDVDGRAASHVSTRRTRDGPL